MSAPRIRAVILAGGSGTRFWPRSRRALPKQFLRFGSARSLLREAFERVLPLSGPAGVVVAAARDHLERIRRELPEVPSENHLGEPMGRDTAACVGFAAEWLAARGEPAEGVMLVCPSDHRIRPQPRFEEAVRTAAGIAARGGGLVTFGVAPQGPSTAFGYIQRGDPLGPAGIAAAYRARRFVEKPPRAVAESYLRSGDHYWNSGIFVFGIGAIRSAIARHFPELGAGLEALGARLRAGESAERVLLDGFPGLARNSIDRGVLEKAAAAGEVVVLEAPFEWDDVGSWSALERCLPGDADGNHVEGRHLGLDTAGCLISGTEKRLIATIGLRDLVVVESDDAILICGRGQEERVKDLVALLGSRGEGARV